MTWRNRAGVEAEERLEEIEKTLGIQNLQDVQVDEANSFLYIFTETKKFRITMTEV